MAAMPTDLLPAARALMPQIVAIRRRLHRHPELGLHLPETQEAIVEELERLGLTPRLGKATTSVTAVIGADREGPTTILRGDMDALPLTERSGLDFASEIDGRMHACGHDTHVAMLLGGARLLVERAEDLPGPVVLMFQPGEEGFFGARFMLDEGLLDGLDPARTGAFAIHISKHYLTGEIHGRRGPLLASADEFRVTVHGRGGHASAPHLAIDPILVAAEIVAALQTSLTRETDVFDPAVITVAHFEAGTTHNVIPDRAFLEGTYRAVSSERRAALPQLIRRVVEGVSAAHGATADIEFEEGYPVTVNDAEVADLVRALAEGLIGADSVHTMPAPIMGAEDFSYVVERVPGAMVFLGGRASDEDPATYADNHSDLVVFDEPAMAVGAALYAEVGLRLFAADRG
jgi:amidohydrolase